MAATHLCGQSSMKLSGDCLVIVVWLLGTKLCTHTYISTHVLACSLLALMESYFYKVLNQIQLHNFSSDNLLKIALLKLMADYNLTYITYVCVSVSIYI